MNSQYPGQAYPQRFFPNGHQSHGNSTSRPRSYPLTTHGPTGAPTLPPISTPQYASTFGHETINSRVPRLQPSPITTGPNSLYQPAPVPIYGPTGTTFFAGPGQTTGYAPSPPPSQPLRPPPYASAPTQPSPSYPPTQPSTSTRLLNIRPMPIDTQHGERTSQTKSERLIAAALKSPEDSSQPVHVVGSQGRRGILPSAAGRPPAIGENGVNNHKGSAAPVKDSDGKYPCEHCSKTYLHAKHLKRHMLRHTGVRPYTCGLCRDTFSRSDILKRHFQKCSVRRGNPTGESHLSHSRANKKRHSEDGDASAAEASTPTDQSEPSSAFTTTGFGNALEMRGIDMSQVSFGEAPQPSPLHPLSRSNSMKRSKASRNSSNRGSLGMAPTSAYEPNGYGFATGQVTPDSGTTSGAATPYTYPHETRSSQISPDGTLTHTPSEISLGMPLSSRPPTVSHYSTGSLPHIVEHSNGSNHAIDWRGFSGFQSHEDYPNSHYSGTVTPQHQLHIKDEHLDFSSMQQNMFQFSK